MKRSKMLWLGRMPMHSCVQLAVYCDSGFWILKLCIRKPFCVHYALS